MNEQLQGFAKEENGTQLVVVVDRQTYMNIKKDVASLDKLLRENTSNNYNISACQSITEKLLKVFI